MELLRVSHCLIVLLIKRALECVAPGITVITVTLIMNGIFAH